MESDWGNDGAGGFGGLFVVVRIVIAIDPRSQRLRRGIFASGEIGQATEQSGGAVDRSSGQRHSRQGIGQPR